ncbi:MAG: membrane protein insertion efficiency factor YidD [Chlamydiales bacterium]
MKNILIFLIHIYRLLISPLLGPSCRFVPSCSEYAQDALKKHPLFKACWLICKRLIKCGPWNKGGYDPLPHPLNREE